MFSHITITDNEIPPPTSDVVDVHTVGNVWINTSQVKGKWRSPGYSGGTSKNITHTIQVTLIQEIHIV